MKLQAAEAAISRSLRTAANSKSLSTRTTVLGGNISKKPTKKSVTAEKRGVLLRKLQTSNGKSATHVSGASSSHRRRVVMPKVQTSIESILRESLKTADTPVNSSLDGVVNMSKSARKRKNKATKENLAGKSMNDLMDALSPDEFATADIEMDEGMDEDDVPVQKPEDPYLSTKRDRPVSNKAGEKVVKQEIDRFSKVMTEQSFRENPFAALRGFINQRI